MLCIVLGAGDARGSKHVHSLWEIHQVGKGNRKSSTCIETWKSAEKGGGGQDDSEAAVWSDWVGSGTVRQDKLWMGRRSRSLTGLTAWVGVSATTQAAAPRRVAT